ncbi:MAG: hypothetical protein RLZZ330_755, partial [Actinomycetota bacterium]
PKKAIVALGISAKQITELDANQNLLTAKCSPAIEIYNGVLFDAFDYQNLSAAAKKTADKSIIITSALFGLLRTQDAIPHYRLSGSVSLPKIGSFQKVWQPVINEVLSSQNFDLVIDLRSGTYAKFWQPTENLISKTVVIKIMSRVGKGKATKKIAISHNNKHTKGLIARDLVGLKAQPKNQAQLLKSLESLGYEVEVVSNPNKPVLFEVFI